jgi:hypothetical protein
MQIASRKVPGYLFLPQIIKTFGYAKVIIRQSFIVFFLSDIVCTGSGK